MIDSNEMRECGEIVEEGMYGLEQELYSCSEDGRREIYRMVLSHLCWMLLIDGGPTSGIKILKEGLAELQRFEKARGLKRDGPFLSDAQLEILTETPGRFLRQDIRMVGPVRWTVVDDYFGG